MEANLKPRLRRFFWPLMGAWAWATFARPDAERPVITGLSLLKVYEATALKFPRVEGAAT
jgi:hypothetical protein